MERIIGEGEYTWEITLAYYECPHIEEYQKTLIVLANSRGEAISFADSECGSGDIIYLIDGYRYDN